MLIVCPTSLVFNWVAEAKKFTTRADRIGQTRVVTSYKLISRGTLEEKILALQQDKRAIIKATLGGEESLADTLTWEEIKACSSRFCQPAHGARIFLAPPASGPAAYGRYG